MEAHQIPRIETPTGIDEDNEEFQAFVEEVWEEIEEHLEHNHQEAHGLTDVEKSVDEVLAVQNTRSFDARAERLENPRVRLWLKDCPIWANDCWETTVYPRGLNAYNGDVTVTIDVRPF